MASCSQGSERGAPRHPRTCAGPTCRRLSCGSMYRVPSRCSRPRALTWGRVGSRGVARGRVGVM
eukprot:5085694-Prymnesium_polylepis.1